MKPYPKTKPSGVEWLGEVPEHWEVKRLRWVGDAIIGLTYSPNDVVGEDEGTLVLRSSNIQGGRIVLDDNVYVSAEIPRKLRTKVDDILICTRNGSRALVGKTGKVSDLEAGLTFGAFTAVFRSPANDYIFYVFNSGLFSFQAGLFQTSTIFQLTNGTINAFQIPLPPPPEQTAIAAYLDRETGRIDELVGKKRELIERIKEKRTALISRTVTRGLRADLPPATLAKLEQIAGEKLPLNPPLSPSGLESLPEVPSQWRTSKVWLERVSRNLEYQDGNHGELHPKAADYVDDGIPFIMANNLVAGEVDFDSCKKIELELAKSLRIGFATEGDVLLTHKGTIGRTAIVQRNAYPFVMLTPQVTYYRCIDEIFPNYLFWFFQGKFWQDEMALISSLGSTRGYVGLLDQRSLHLILPPANEQKAIAAYLGEEAAKLDTLVAKVETAIERLQEYRTALITAAVTGKIDVRNHQPTIHP